MITLYDFTQSVPSTDELKALFSSVSRPTDYDLLRFKAQLNNLLQAWQAASALAHQQIDSGQPPKAIAECVYFALVYTTLDRLMQLSGYRMLRMLEEHLWTPQNAIDLIASITDTDERLRLYVDLLKTDRLSTEQNRHIQEMLMDVLHNEPQRLIALSVMTDAVALLSEAYLPQVQAAIKQLGPPAQLELFHKLAKRYDGEPQVALYDHAANIAAALPDPYTRAAELVKLLPYFSGDTLNHLRSISIEAILLSTRPDSDDYSMLWQDYRPYATREFLSTLLTLFERSLNDAALVGMVTMLSEYMDQAQIERTFQLGLAVKNGWLRVQLFVTLAYRLPLERKHQALREATDATLSIDDTRYRLWAFTLILANASEQQAQDILPLAMDYVLSIGIESMAANYVARFSAKASGENLKRIMDTALSFTDSAARFRLLFALADKLSPKQCKLALDAALAIRNPEHRAKSLIQLLELEALQSEREQILNAAIQAADRIRNHERREQALAKIKLQFSEGEAVETPSALIEKKLFDTREIIFRQREHIKERWTAYTLAHLGRYLPKAEQDRAFRLALDVALQEHFDDYLADSLEVIAPGLPKFYLDEAFEAALEISDHMAQVWALTGLLAYLDVPQRSKAVQACLKIVLPLQKLPDDDYFKTFAAAQLLPFLEGHDRETVLGIGLSAKWTQGSRYGELLEYLRPENRLPIVQRIIETDIPQHINMGEQDIAANMLFCTAKYLPDNLRETALNIANVLTDTYERDKAVSGLAIRIGNQRGLDLAASIQNAWWRSSALYGISTHATDPLRETAVKSGLEAVHAITPVDHRLIQIVAYLEIVYDRTAHVRLVQHTLIETLWQQQSNRTVDVLQLCAHKLLFVPLFVPAEVLNQVAQYIHVWREAN